MSKLTSAQLAIVLQKQLSWKQSGIKTGSGKDFDIESVCNSIKSSPPKELKPVHITKKGKKNKSTKAANNEIIEPSPHATRLQWLLKNGDTTSEHYHQVRYFYILERFDPEIYEDMCGIPMGDFRAGLAGARIKAEGAKKGSPDLNYDLPKGIYHGLRIEMKRPAVDGIISGRLSAIQIKRMKRARHNGYYVTVCYGFMEALFVVWEYNALKPNEEMRTRPQDHVWISD